MKKYLAPQLKFSLALFSIILFMQSSALSLATEKRLEDPILEQKAHKIFKQIRCLVCQGQAISGSDTEFSINLRQLIREKIKEGESDQEIIQDLADNFGDQILVSSDFSSNSEKILIILPLILCAAILILFLRRVKISQ